MEKGGFLAVEWVVSIILILVGLGILIFAVTNLFTQNDVDKNTCHFSVISRGSTPSLAKGYVPLRCKTEKICITGELFGGECDGGGCHSLCGFQRKTGEILFALVASNDHESPWQQWKPSSRN